MKKTLLLTLVAITSLMPFRLRADENQPVSVQIPMQKTGHIKHVRELISIPVLCYYYASSACLKIEASMPFGTFEVFVTNHSTGEIWYDIFDSDHLSEILLQLSGLPGSYTIACKTSSGNIYGGTFAIE